MNDKPRNPNNPIPSEDRSVALPDLVEILYMHPIPGTNWSRYTPPQLLLIQSEFDNPEQAATALSMADAVFDSVAPEGSDARRRYMIDSDIEAGELSMTVTPVFGLALTEIAYRFADRLTERWREADTEGLVAMKPRAQFLVFGDAAPAQGPWFKKVHDIEPVNGTPGHRVTYCHPLVATYQFETQHEAVLAAEVAAEAVADARTSLKVKVTEATLCLALTPRAGRPTEVEFGLVPLIEDALVVRGE